MSAPTGNTNASQWTREKTHHVLDQIEAMALDEFSICHTLTQALLRLKYYKQLWSYFKKKWENDGDIMDRIYYIEQIFIHKLEEGALFRRMHPGACYFILRNNYGYNTKGENELPSHLMADLEAHQSDTALAAESAQTQPVSKPTKDTPRKDFSPQYTDHQLSDRFDIDVRRNPQIYDTGGSIGLKAR